MAAILQRAGLRPSDVLSTRSRAYRAMGLAEGHRTDDELLDLMVQEPTLLRRPLIVGPEGVAVGYNPKRMEELADAAQTKE